jgi:putative phosphoribosyl transferase
VYIVRKLGVPDNEELAMGAVASDGSYVVDESILEAARVTPAEFQAALARELAELHRRETIYRDGRPEPQLLAKKAIVVDDGLATGASMYSAIQALRKQHLAEIVVAVPVAPAATIRRLELVADRVVCPYQPVYFGSVGAYYDDFAQVGDAEVRNLLSASARERETWKVA